ncbi:MAG: PleD family two-component system response regulator [Mesorhizobium sp.]
MSARILVVDDIPANLKLLEGRLLAEYFAVETAVNGEEALAICRAGRADVVLLDIMMPGIDGFEVCRQLKADWATAHIPVVMVTALDGISDRIQGLEAGADDFLTKPVNDMQLLTRVRSLVRLKMLGDELRLRAATNRDLGIDDLLGRKDVLGDARANVLLVDQKAHSRDRLIEMLNPVADVTVATDPQGAIFQAAEGRFDCVVISSGLIDFDPLRLCSQLRSLDRTRFLPIMLVVEQGQDELVTRALELGVNDYVVRPADEQEVIARLRTQIRRKRYNEELRAGVAQTLEMAVMDPLTGLHNRRYLDTHLETLFKRAVARRRPLSVMMTDIDRFKSINDTFGHAGGDVVLREFSRRLRKNVRGIDLACRFGGEEFVVIMPDTEHEVARMIAERIRAEIETEAFRPGSADDRLTVTVSIGVATLSPGDSQAGDLLKRADGALYEAKSSGRNKVVSNAA